MLLVLLLPFIALMFLKAPYLESAWVETFMIGLYAVYLWRICTHIHWVRARRIGAA